MRVAYDAAASAGQYPLVVLSHGTGSSHLVLRELAVYLARRGFVVASPEHARNNRNDNSLAGTAANLANRPRQLRQVIDAIVTEPFVLPGGVVVIGHSLGGYTALALAGGSPSAFAHETGAGQPLAISVAVDERVTALVLLAPATVWYREPGALANVRVPVLMLTAEKDPHTPQIHGQIVCQGLPNASKLTHREIPNAGHFSFLSPFPVSMCGPGFAPSQDPEGFDRSRFLPEMYAEIENWLKKQSGQKG